VTRPASPFALPPIKRKPTVKRDTADEAAEKAYVRARDKGCVAQKAARYPILTTPAACDGPLQVDHVRTSGALSKKSVTHRKNMVLLCSWHHRLKTEYGRTWRPLLLAYLERVEGTK
jgi:hypothetical protein